MYLRIGSSVIDFSSEGLVIEPGMTAYGLHAHLEIEIPYWAYKLWIRQHHPDVRLKTGEYPIHTDTVTISKLFDEILQFEPHAPDIAITILPGWHLQEIENLLTNTLTSAGHDMRLVTRDEPLLHSFRDTFPFLSGAISLEGFLYPDTYRVYPDATLEDVVSIMLTRFDELIYRHHFEGVPGLSFYETLILASIVEEEEKSSANKPVVAGILLKRLQKGWYLGTDVTVCYASLLPGDQCLKYVNQYYGSSEAYREAQNNHYDTRRFLGLPPTPISSVSSDTFSSVITSEPSDYYYYLHGRDGQIRYGRDASEHEYNKKTYLHRQ